MCPERSTARLMYARDSGVPPVPELSVSRIASLPPPPKPTTRTSPAPASCVASLSTQLPDQLIPLPVDPP